MTLDDQTNFRPTSAQLPPTKRPERIVKVAVIGSGLAGLTATYLLATLARRPDVEFEGEDVRFEVHVFEKASTLGMDSHSVSFEHGGAEWRVDVPMRSFQGGYYPQLIAFYTHLQTRVRQADFSYSFSTLQSLPKINNGGKLELHPHFIYDGSSGRKGLSVPTMLTQRTGYFNRAWSHTSSILHTLLVFMLFLRFALLSAPFLRPKPSTTWAEWAAQSTPQGPLAKWFGFTSAWEDFITNICGPIFSAVCTASAEDVAMHPAEDFLDFNWKTFGTHHYVVANGVRDVVARLSEPLPTEHVHLDSAVTSLAPDTQEDGLVNVICGSSTHPGFAHVILATPANLSASLVKDYAKSIVEKKSRAAVHAARLGNCLSRVAYRESVVVTHTDATFLPSDPSDHRDLNMATAAGTGARAPGFTSGHDKVPESELVVGPSYTMTTHRLPRPENISPKLFAGEEAGIYQTTNPIIPPSSASVLSVSRLERALLTVDGKAAVRELYGPTSLQGAARREFGNSAAGVWAVGAYAASGIPLLEGCVESSLAVVTGENGIVIAEGGEVRSSLW